MENLITLNLSVEQTNLVLRGLSGLPYQQVYTLVNDIVKQASNPPESDVEAKESE